jgi:hypothetical protein
LLECIIVKLVSQSELAVELNASGFAFSPAYLQKKATAGASARHGTIEKSRGLNEIQEVTPKKAAD